MHFILSKQENPLKTFPGKTVTNIWLWKIINQQRNGDKTSTKKKALEILNIISNF